jgi:hypothetical protein
MKVGQRLVWGWTEIGMEYPFVGVGKITVKGTDFIPWLFNLQEH